MKKSYFLMLAAIAMMTLGACSGSEPEQTPSSIPAVSSVAPSSVAPTPSSEAPTPSSQASVPGENLKTWSSAELKAALTNQNLDELDFGNDVKGYKTDGMDFTLNYESASAKTVTFKLLLSVKIKNNSSAKFWTAGSKPKTSISVNGVDLQAPAEDWTLADKGCTEQSTVEAEAGKPMTVPVWVDIIDIDLIAGNNTIRLQNLSGDYSFFICGAAIA